jgi:hypothetical protein
MKKEALTARAVKKSAKDAKIPNQLNGMPTPAEISNLTSFSKLVNSQFCFWRVTEYQ